MLDKKNHIDNLFADYLSDYQEKTPDYVWYNIQAELKDGKIRKRKSIIRAIAATIALLITFGIGYYSSDYTRSDNFQTRNIKINPDEFIFNSNTKINENIVQKFKQGEELTIKYNLPQTIRSQDSDPLFESKSVIYKLFYSPKDIFLSDSKRLGKLSSNKDLNKKTTNQLLIDTLLFKKENLSERGFLLSENKDNHSRWTFGTKFSPVYSLAENTKQSNVEISDQMERTKSLENKPNTKADEKSLMSFSGGLTVNYHFTKRWSIESGVYYSQHRQMAENVVASSFEGLQDEMSVYTPEGVKYLPASNLSEINSQEVIGSSQDETYYSMGMDYVSNFEYIELPLIVRYRIIDQRLGLDVLSGVSTNFLVSNKSSLMYKDEDLWSGASDGISPMLYNATIALGVNYRLYNNLSLNIEPTFKYFMFPYQSSTMLKYPYSFAIFAGFSLRF